MPDCLRHDPGAVFHPTSSIRVAGQVEGPVGREALLERLCGRGRSRISHDRLGAPRLDWPAWPGCGISFSRRGGMIWGALNLQGPVGLDVHHAHDFGRRFPWQRAFCHEEMQSFAHAGLTLRQGAALLWAAKEAAVKWAGCGFHYLDYWQVHCHPPRRLHGAWQLTVRAGNDVPVRAWPLAGGWLTLAAREGQRFRCAAA